VSREFDMGPWRADEDARLIELVKQNAQYQTGDGTLPSSGISWTSISNQLGTRSHQQVRHRYYRIIFPRLATDSGFTLEEERRLITTVRSFNAEDISEIDWSLACPPHRYAAARSRFQIMVKHVPDNESKSFSEIVETLYNMYHAPPPQSEVLAQERARLLQEQADRRTRPKRSAEETDEPSPSPDESTLSQPDAAAGAIQAEQLPTLSGLGATPQQLQTVVHQPQGMQLMPVETLTTETMHLVGVVPHHALSHAHTHDLHAQHAAANAPLLSSDPSKSNVDAMPISEPPSLVVHPGSASAPYLTVVDSERRPRKSKHSAAPAPIDASPPSSSSSSSRATSTNLFTPLNAASVQIPLAVGVPIASAAHDESSSAHEDGQERRTKRPKKRAEDGAARLLAGLANQR
jgi:hypothetical protein